VKEPRQQSYLVVDDAEYLIALESNPPGAFVVDGDRRDLQVHYTDGPLGLGEKARCLMKLEFQPNITHWYVGELYWLAVDFWADTGVRRIPQVRFDEVYGLQVNITSGLEIIKIFVSYLDSSITAAERSMAHFGWKVLVRVTESTALRVIELTWQWLGAIGDSFVGRYGGLNVLFSPAFGLRGLAGVSGHAGQSEKLAQTGSTGSFTLLE